MTAWPPQQLTDIYRRLNEWDAWYVGDRQRLEHAYQHNPNATSGLVGTVARLWRRFWGATIVDPKAPLTVKVHVPLAADIARGSADLLFADPPSLNSDDKATQELLQGFLDGGLIQVFAGAAEICAAIGGVYVRIVADTADKRLFCTRMDYDLAEPTFVYGELAAVKFYRVVAEQGADVWRHVESYETLDGVGIVRHQLFKGDAGDVGVLQPLATLPALAELAAAVDTDGDAITTGTPGLSVVHFPNITPNAMWRKHPVGAHLGQADISGAEDLLDRLDHAYSAMLREVDLAKARIIVPESMLDLMGAGKGVAFDQDRDIWSPVNAAPSPAAGDMTPQLIQPDIRIDKYLAVMQQITEDILRRAGYSTQSFGEDEDGAATATEVNSKDRRTDLTKSRKLRIWAPGIERLLRKMVAMSVALFQAAGDPEQISVEFSDGSSATPLELAQTVALMEQAKAASRRTKVATLHPDWDKDQVDAEVALLDSENQMEDPTTFTGGFPTQTGQPAEPAAPTIEGATP